MIKTTPTITSGAQANGRGELPPICRVDRSEPEERGPDVGEEGVVVHVGVVGDGERLAEQGAEDR